MVSRKKHSMIGILDYGAGNLHSVNNALTFLGAKSKIVSEKNDIHSFSYVDRTIT